MGRMSFAVSATVALSLGWSGAARAADALTVSPRVAAHVGRIEGDRVTWESVFLDDGPGAADASGERIDLARPFPGELDTSRSPGVAAITDARGAIVGFAVEPRRRPYGSGSTVVVVRAPLVRVGDEVVLAPPLARGESVQRLAVSGEGELRFEPAPSTGLVHDVGSWSDPGIAEGSRRAADAALGGRDLPLDEAPIYLRASSSVLAGGLRGHALTATERSRPGRILAVLVFALLAAGCAAAYRRLGRDARIEQAEAVLREEFERHGR